MLTQMCSNRAIVDSLECCVDDLVECFEDFVKKSLILIFLGIGIIVGLLCYLLKVVSERPPLSNSIIVPENISHKQNEANALIEKNKVVEQEVKSNNLLENDNKKNYKISTDIVAQDTHTDKDNVTKAKNTSNLPIVPSFDENLLREVGLTSCSKYGCGVGSNSHIYIPSRVPVPSIPTSSSKHKLIPCIRKRSLNKSNLPSLQICSKITKPGSCCSMCCYDGQKQNEDLDRQIYRNH